MNAVARALQLESSSAPAKHVLPLLVTAAFFAGLFHNAFTTLLRDWWSNPDAGHGLLLGPLAVWLAWRSGLAPERKPQPVAGIALLAGAILLRYVAGLAAELFTLRFSLMLALAALVVFYFGIRQLLRWWLPATLLFLAVPLPTVVLGSVALPLQLQASEFGAALLAARDVPVVLAGNVIHLPGRSLFVTEACSGLRSLTALIALGVLIGGLWLRSPGMRIAIVALAVPIAMLLNGIRIFLTGFLVYFVDPRLGDGLMHYTEGWALFAVAFLLLGAVAWVLTCIEGVYYARKVTA
jgi:exosortase